MLRPEMTALPKELLRAAREVGERLAAEGRRSWVVGGAVRDLCMGRSPKDIDLTTNALPEEVEGRFQDTVPLGKRFGTVLVKVAGLGVEVTTLRGDGEYGDARRPDEVVFGSSVADDAARRDFTCNAMYLDAISGEFLDPVHGLGDLNAGALVTVGDPKRRFAEDGLRLLRLARFASTLGLAPSAATIAGAQSSLPSLRGVSGERMLAELVRAFSAGAGGGMLMELARIGVASLMSGSQLTPDELSAVFEGLGASPSLGLGLCLLLDPDPAAPSGSLRSDRRAAMEESLARLKPPRELRSEVLSIWALTTSLENASTGDISPGELRLWMRESAWSDAARLARASCVKRGESPAVLDKWIHEREALSEEELHPDPLVSSDLLQEAGVARGPLWGVLMREGLLLQLGGELKSRDAALRWLLERGSAS